MNGYTIRTAYGNVYKTDEDGYVLEYSNGLKEARNSESRKTWQITGAWFNIGFGHIRTIPLKTMMVGRILSLILTNGQPRFGLTDIDHGTKRIHGNKEYHGIVSISTY